ncbi:MAG TPA: type I methionyl aminopeptidase [Gemmatimonadales bacterium]
MVTLKSPREIEIMARSGRIAAETLELVATLVRPGVTTEELDQAAERHIRAQGAKPSFKGLYGFPKSLCISVDEEIVHGIPSRKRSLREGSVVSVDVGVFLEGLHSDHARTFAVGAITEDAQRLLDVTERALHAGVEQARLGNHVGDISHAIQATVEAAGFGVFRELVGHGVGQRMHEDPQVPNFGLPKRGPRLQEGMTLAIEPMTSAGTIQTRTLPDRWTVVTADRAIAAHFEHTVAVTRDGPRILTTLGVPAPAV